MNQMLYPLGLRHDGSIVGSNAQYRVGLVQLLGVCCAKLFGLLVLFGVSVAFAGPKVVKEDKVVKENKVAKNGSNAGNGNLVPGNPEALAWEAMPDHSTPATVDKSEISIDPETGAEVIRTTLYISFTAKATVAQVNSLLEEINGRILVSLAGNGAVSVGFPDPGTLPGLETLIKKIKSNPIVKIVKRDSIRRPAVYCPKCR